jgi:RNA polymerase primary sigma factor
METSRPCRRRRRQCLKSFKEKEFFMNPPSSFYSDYLSAYLQSAYQAPLLSREEETALVVAMENGGSQGIRARNALVTAHLKMVVPVAKKFLGYGVPLEDLIQEGNEGLIKAAAKFKRDFGTRFSTFAWWYVRVAVKEFASDNHSTVRIPATKRKVLAAFKKALKTLSENREPASDERIAKLMNVPVKDVRELADLALIEVSLNAKIGEEDGSAELGDMLEDTATESVEDRVMSAEVKAAVRASLDVLDDRERAIISGRFGLDDEDSLTLEDLSKQFGVSRERIRQIEAKALEKLARLQKLRAVR